ncbi:DnaA ATPase domain-containing protein [Candidatus Neptunochlamydia vexilliferae]|uniref:Chromosomal replication initiator protein DnaA n=1 Tax=Candidatus Neptunichlamydia vexilliferae TaxID=1651774 RepID=A0ABS0AWX3_9BACT|nr:DnaA/Hda family protein [Candidatus Neptunochlamydia vexilliferae]MBF5058639.1 Chromosomal replication initiator protein DnaA 1 [Candidatus Neptunochlamydia vexilliferae]
MKQWNELLRQFDQELGKETVTKWLRSLKVIKFDAANLYLDATDTFQINWFKEYVAPLLPHRFVTARGKPIKIHFSIGGNPCDIKKKKEVVEAPSLFPSDPLQPHATFDEFVVGKSENLPYKIFSELVEGNLPLGGYNPIYIYGPKGCGKSHLLMATGAALEGQGKRCFYVRADTFTEHVIRAFRSTSLQEFRHAYRDIEVLLIDDVELFSRKRATQEELFHTFNRLHTAGLQIIVSSALAPQMLEEIEERLVSRFEWGITLSLTPPSLEEKEMILENRAEALALPLDPPLKSYLLDSFKNLHSLIQALEALALRLPHVKGAPDLEIATFHLKDLAEKEKETFLTPEKVLKIVANQFGIKTEDILGKAQNKECALPRQIAMYLCRENLKMPFLKIGRMFSRDHSTVMTSVKRVKKGIEKKEEGFLLPLSDIQRILV